MVDWTVPNHQRNTLVKGIAEVPPSVTKFAQVRFQYGLACQFGLSSSAPDSVPIVRFVDVSVG